MAKPIDFAASQVVGTVESVSPREIVVRLDPSAPQATALNAGHVQRFPRINGWVLIPSEVGYLVGTVTWIGVERDNYSPQISRSDRALVNLPFPNRRMVVIPLGTLQWRGETTGGRPELQRGISSYPSVGESVLVPTPRQSQAIVQGDDDAHVVIGTSPLAGDIEVRIDPDKLFGRHLAILGNTGSGKSCTVAGLIRGCMEAASADASTSEETTVLAAAAAEEASDSASLVSSELATLATSRGASAAAASSMADHAAATAAAVDVTAENLAAEGFAADDVDDSFSAVLDKAVADQYAAAAAVAIAESTAAAAAADAAAAVVTAAIAADEAAIAATTAATAATTAAAATARLDSVPNARFVVLDPNGEYSRAFDGLPNTRVLNISVTPDHEDTEPLKVPAWMWNSDEWAGVLSARPGVQRPVLNEALRTLRAGTTNEPAPTGRADQLIRGYHAQIREMANSLDGYQGWPGAGNFGRTLTNCIEDLQHFGIAHLSTIGDDLIDTLIKSINSAKWESKGKVGYNAFSTVTVDEVLDSFKPVLEKIPSLGPVSSGVNIDAPLMFDNDSLADHIDFLAGQPRYSGSSQHIAPMTLRLRTILGDERINPIISADKDQSLLDWLALFLGDDDSVGTITVIDLSLVPSDVLHTSVSVIARIIFEALQRYRKHHRTELPTVLVLEEAHTFISNQSGDIDSPTARHMCRSVFERIAREGRKFGLSLVLSSQRPSELSATVLAQCNSFLLHRLVNDSDQALVKRLVPDALGDLLNELPSLPSRQAILLGWASLLPTLVQISEVPEEHRPHSNDPAFWDVWSGAEPRPTDWPGIVDTWIK
ncbi:DUF87 domain-containing protein [Rhodococcus qingshengii]|uniref:helicase HerA domain-containing protein n=1 Tax=Rhodococcus qingshengii TaxID=334542 RepID=UPI0028F29E54|nr:DUF87 domain-containing protein [Rhodococcus qingshengii]MDT9664636.1 DUF87 domain-containing protein [Rhodococcus qingshengii]